MEDVQMLTTAGYKIGMLICGIMGLYTIYLTRYRGKDK